MLNYLLGILFRLVENLKGYKTNKLFYLKLLSPQLAKIKDKSRN